VLLALLALLALAALAALAVPTCYPPVACAW
jgi:hypothetical protein